MENQFTNLSSYNKPRSPKIKAFIYVVAFALLIGGAIFFGNYFLSTHQSSKKPLAPTSSPATPTPTQTPVASPSATPTPLKSKVTPTPTLKPGLTATAAPVSKSLQIEVLNGSGTSGQAGKVASLLRGDGYGITSTGNAATFDYPQTVIQIKKSKSTLAAQLKKDLSVSYTVDPTIQTLAESATPDAIVIVGAK